MRLPLLILCFLFCFQQLKAQEDFIRAGAQWRYNMTYGSFRQYVHSDTIVAGVPCKLIRTETYVDSLYFYYGLRVYNLPDKFIYSSNDTVYAYNRVFGKFTPLYIFNVQAGDTIALPMHWPEGAGWQVPKGDSTFRLIIDSVKMELYDTVYLKTVYSHPDSSHIGNAMVYGKYTWNIGGARGLMPKCAANCIYFLDDRAQESDDVRCYSDDRIAVKYVTGNCDRGKSLSIPADTNPDYKISIHPNPASQTIFITNNSLAKIATATIISVDGRVYKHYEKQIPGKIAVADMPMGTYLLRLQTEEGAVFTKKLVIMR